MTQEELVLEIRKHIPVLAKEGCDITELREIAPAIIVAFDASDGTFIYYFSNSDYDFRTDRESQMWSANDQCGSPEGCANEVKAFVCGINRPKDWSEVIGEAFARLIRVTGEFVPWHARPVEIPFE